MEIRRRTQTKNVMRMATKGRRMFGHDKEIKEK